MIRPRFAALSLFALLTATAGARAVDKDKLQRTIRLPEVSFFFAYGVNRLGDFVNYADQGPQPREIAEIKRKLRGDATDAERYLHLGRLYFQASQPARANKTFRKLESLCREQIERHPHDNVWRLWLAEALEELDKLEEAEPLLRCAVKDCPDDWHSWLGLGTFLDYQSWRAITGGKPFHPVGPDQLLQSVRAAAPTPERIAASRQYRKEAVACFDRAIALAPCEPEVYRQRGASRYHYGFLDCGLRWYKGEKADFNAILLPGEAMPDLRKAVDLSTDEYVGIGMVVLMDAMAEVHQHHLRPPSAKEPERWLDVLPEIARKRVREGLARLEKGAQNPDKRKAAEAVEILGVLQFVICRDIPAAEKSLRRSIALDPSRKAAWDALAACLEDYSEKAEVCSQRLKHEDSPHTRLLLAKAYEDLKQLGKAEEVIREGLRREPDDFMLNLTLVDLLLMRGEDEGLKQAGQLLYKMQKEQLPAGGSENRWGDYVFACGIYFGLVGKREQAREWLEKLQERQPEYPHIKEALDALGESREPVTPTPLP